MDTRNTPHRRLQTQSKTTYLQLYNGASALCWLAVLGRVLLLIPLVGFENVYGGVGNWTRWTQTCALLEVLHASLGIVRSPVSTTALQVISRLFLVWPILSLYGAVPDVQGSIFYSSMLLAWSITEVVRYSYFFLNLQGQQASNGASGGGGVPEWLSWARYNLFFVLYPLGIGSECALVWKTSQLEGRDEVGEGVRWVLWGVLALYVPGSWVLYGHMMKQRRRVRRGKGKERS